jgi:hypothetical protein
MTSARFQSLIFQSLLLLASLGGGDALAQRDQRTVDGGQVLGAAGQDPRILVFKAIPNAAPPVGQLRWGLPQSVKAWSGTRSARDCGPTCIGRNFGFIAKSDMSEDCLYLNVWTSTANAGARTAVLVWIHGGGYRPCYDGEEFAERDVVMVAFNYRVGVPYVLCNLELVASSAFDGAPREAWWKTVDRSISKAMLNYWGNLVKTALSDSIAFAKSLWNRVPKCAPFARATIGDPRPWI